MGKTADRVWLEARKAVSLALVNNGGVPFLRAFCAKASLRFCFYKDNGVLGPCESGIIEIALA